MIRRIALTLVALLGAPSLAGAHGGETHAEPPGWDSWSFPALQVALIAVAAGLYARRARRLRTRRGAYGTVASWRAWVFAAGLAIVTLSLVSPLDSVGEGGLFAVHMLQHVLIGDVAPLLLALGLTGPLLQPILSIRIVERLRILTDPVISLALWVTSIVAWHLPLAYEAALESPVLHALEHACFVGFGLLMWMSIVESLPAPQWFGTGAKIAYVGVVRLVTAVLGNIFWWSGTVFYDRYAATAPHYGFTPLEDQANAGTVMMVESGLVTLILLVVLFFRMAREGELRQHLIEQGLPPDQVRRAVRYNRGEALAQRLTSEGTERSPIQMAREKPDGSRSGY